MKKKTLTPGIKSAQQEDFITAVGMGVVILICVGAMWLMGRIK